MTLPESRAFNTSPASRAFSITPNDSDDLSIITRGLYVGTSGDVKVDLYGGDTVTFKNLAAGVVHPFVVRRVYSTGTDSDTADEIIGIY